MQLFLYDQCGDDHDVVNNPEGDLSGHSGLHSNDARRSNGRHSAANSLATTSVCEEEAGCTGRLVHCLPGDNSDGRCGIRHRLRRRGRIKFHAHHSDKPNPSGDEFRSSQPHSPIRVMSQFTESQLVDHGFQRHSGAGAVVGISSCSAAAVLFRHDLHSITRSLFMRSFAPAEPM
jgi:hypothetical protein